MTFYNKYGGAEIFFFFIPEDNRAVTLRTDALALARAEKADANWWLVPSREISLTITTAVSGGTTKVTCQPKIDDVVVDEITTTIGENSGDTFGWKIVMAADSISVYCSGLWVYTYVYKEVMWPEAPMLYLNRSSLFEITNIRRVELSDRREAIYVDYESTTESGIQSVIQQRPVQTYPGVDRSNSYTYFATRDAVAAHHINSYEEVIRDNQQLSSDGLVYYLDTGISISKATAKAVGLLTRLYRLSELDNGALEAAARIQKFALEKRNAVSIGMRLDPRIEIADVLLIDEVLSGTQTHLLDEVIVEDLSISMQNGSYKMQISARRKQ